MRIIIDNILGLSLLLVLIFLIPWCVSFGIVGYLVAINAFFIIITISLYKISRKNDLSFELCIPIVLSAFQNIGLGIFSPYLSKTEVQLLTVINFLYAIIVFIALFFKYGKRKILQNDIGRKVWFIFVVLIVYSFISVILLSNRNILSIVSLVFMFVIFIPCFFSVINVSIKSYTGVLLLLDPVKFSISS